MQKELLLIVTCSLMLLQCSGNRPANLGLTGGKLAPCPQSPNCVSSQSESEKHFIDPLIFSGPLTETREMLVSAIRTVKRAKIVTLENNYIHTEFTSALFRFVDDGEFYLDEAAHVIHMRSASRLGYSDLGANRKRMESIRDRLVTLQKKKE